MLVNLFKTNNNELSEKNASVNNSNLDIIVEQNAEEVSHNDNELVSDYFMKDELSDLESIEGTDDDNKNILSDDSISKNNLTSLDKQRLQCILIELGLNEEEKKNPLTIARRWKSNLIINYIKNNANKDKNVFFILSYGHKNDYQLNYKNDAIFDLSLDDYSDFNKNCFIYSPLFAVPSNDSYVLKNEFIVWKDKNFTFRLCDLDSYIFCVEVWERTALHFNQYVGSSIMTFDQLLKTNPVFSLSIEMKNRNIMNIGCIFSFVEVITINVKIESGNIQSHFNLNQNVRNYEGELDYSKKYKLRASVPLTAYKRMSIFSREFSLDDTINMNAFTFTGTINEFLNDYIRIDLLARNSANIFQRFSIIGTSLICLSNILNLSNTSVNIINTNYHTKNFVIGELELYIITTKYSYNSQDTAYADKKQNNLTQVKADDAFASSIKQIDDNSFDSISKLTLSNIYLCIRLLSVESAVYLSSKLDIFIEWDNMKYKVFDRQATIFPIRLSNEEYIYSNNINAAIKNNSSTVKVINQNDYYEKNVLGYEIKYKGDIKLLVYSNSIFIGSALLNIASLCTGTLGERSLLEEYNNVKEIDYSYWLMKDGKSFLNKKFQTIITSIRDIKVLDINSQGNNTLCQANLSAELYVLPSLPTDLKIPGELEYDKDRKRYLMQLKYLWDKDCLAWSFAYSVFFIQSRRLKYYPAIYKSADNKYICLNQFLASAYLPTGLETVGKIFNFVCSIAFNISNKYNFISLNDFLLNKIGTVNDHSCLLASLLTGAGLDAYVAIGSNQVEPLEPYSWVVTRNNDNSITFWDSYLRKIYTLPKRFGVDARVIKNQIIEIDIKDGYTQRRTNAGYYNGKFLCDYYNTLALKTNQDFIEYPLDNVNDKDIEYNIEALEAQLHEEIFASNQAMNNQKRLSAEEDITIKIKNAALLNSIDEDIGIFPIKELKRHELLTYTPYFAINVCFNQKNVYRNLQNHDPTAIYYDFESPYQWAALFGSADTVPGPLHKQLLFNEPATTSECAGLSESIKTEIEDFIILHRNKLGLSVQFELNEETSKKFDELLTILEFRNSLDLRCDPGPNAASCGFSNSAINAIKKRIIDVNSGLDINENDEKLRLNEKSELIEGNEHELTIKNLTTYFENITYRKSMKEYLKKPKKIYVQNLECKSQLIKVLSFNQLKNYYLERLVFDRSQLFYKSTNSIIVSAGSHSMYKPIEDYYFDSENDDDGNKDRADENYNNDFVNIIQEDLENDSAKNINKDINEQDGNMMDENNEFNNNMEKEQADDENEEMSIIKDEQLKKLLENLNTGLLPYHHKVDLSKTQKGRQLFKIETDKWLAYYENEDSFVQWANHHLLNNPNTFFCGFPLVYSNISIEELKKEFLSSAKVRSLISNNINVQKFFVTVKCFQYLCGVTQCWIFFGIFGTDTKK